LKLARYKYNGKVFKGLVVGDKIRPLREAAPSFFDMDDDQAHALADEERSVSLDRVQLLSPVEAPEKILCVAVNYRLHAREQNLKPPQEPYFFTKFNNALIGNGTPILIPRISMKADWEVELAVIIGKQGKYIDRKQALDHVAGYSVSIDVSFRDLQFPAGWSGASPFGQNWLKGKGLDTSFPLGPWLVTKEEIPDPAKLRLSLTVNGKTKQNATTSEMVFGIPELIEYASAGITLQPGDVISTGTPDGVALFTGDNFLKDGDVIEASIENIGTLRNPVVNETT
jgi:2-keto-4-pentenoate hydratase/2-oxohepta-3-ene-1,7-dioic acid hydratase in catechol pathway